MGDVTASTSVRCRFRRTDGYCLGVRLTEFWQRMDTHFGRVYSRSIATDQVLPQLGGRTVDEALREGESTKAVWRAVCDAFEVSPTLR